jgi:hypothetical protein
LGSLPASHLGQIRRGGHHEGRKPPVDPDKSWMSAGEALGMTAVGVEVRSVDVEADIPADAMPANCGEQDSRPGRDDWLAAVRVDLTDGAKQSSQTACVIVDSDRADGRQGHRAGVAFADPDAEATSPALSIAQPEAIAAASLTLESRGAGLATFALAVLRLGVGGKGPDRGRRQPPRTPVRRPVAARTGPSRAW